MSEEGSKCEENCARLGRKVQGKIKMQDPLFIKQGKVPQMEPKQKTVTILLFSDNSDTWITSNLQITI